MKESFTFILAIFDPAKYDRTNLNKLVIELLKSRYPNARNRAITEQSDGK
jgi:hypothetical protein